MDESQKINVRGRGCGGVAATRKRALKLSERYEKSQENLVAGFQAFDEQGVDRTSDFLGHPADRGRGILRSYPVFRLPRKAGSASTLSHRNFSPD